MRSDTGPPPRGSGRGYTLIEVLVAISIIALLISILIPSLAKARDAGRAAVCLSNQRQIALASTLYSNDNNGFVPREGEDNPERTRVPWAIALRPYIDTNASQEEDRDDLFKSSPYFRDPSRKADAHVIHYVANSIPFRAPGLADPAASFNWRKRRGPTQISRIINPAGVIYMSDYFDDPDGARSHAIYAGNPTDISVAQWYDLWIVAHITGSPTVRRVEPKRHGTGCNAVFFDGHAAPVPATDVRNLALWDDGIRN